MDRFCYKERFGGREIMDDFELQGEKLEETLQDLDRVNSWLGGNKITIEGIKKVLKNSSSQPEVLRIADVGCGNGQILRQISKWAKKEGINCELMGIDANPHAIAIAKRLSANYPEISFKTLNIFSDEFAEMEFDLILCTLTLHHFGDEKIIKLLNDFLGMSKIGVVINDLQRSKIAYHLFRAFCAVFVSNEIARDDGLISILRGFKRKDLEKYSREISVKSEEIRWKWAFRYQWVLYKK